MVIQTSRILTSPIQYQSQVVVINEYGLLLAFNIKNGKVNWSKYVDLKYKGKYKLSRKNMRLYITNSSDTMQVYDWDTGRKHEKIIADSPIESTVTDDNNETYFMTENGNLYYIHK